MGREQRWAASGVVALLGVLWLGVAGRALVEAFAGPRGDDLTDLYVLGIVLVIGAVAVAWLAGGLVTVSRVASGRWRWPPVAVGGGTVAALSAIAVLPVWSLQVVWLALLVGFQALALAAWTALLWTPSPVAATLEDAA